MPNTANHFSRIDYETLNAKQQEVHNFHLIAALLAGYGFATYPIRDDWNGGDMIARHMTQWDKEPMVIQIKSRLTFDRKYMGKRLWIGFPYGPDAFVYPHDDTLQEYLRRRAARKQPLEDSKAWSEGGCVHWPKPTEELLELVKPYKLSVASRFISEMGDFEIMSGAKSPVK